MTDGARSSISFGVWVGLRDLINRLSDQPGPLRTIVAVAFVMIALPPMFLVIFVLFTLIFAFAEGLPESGILLAIVTVVGLFWTCTRPPQPRSLRGALVMALHEAAGSTWIGVSLVLCAQIVFCGLSLGEIALSSDSLERAQEMLVRLREGAEWLDDWKLYCAALASAMVLSFGAKRVRPVASLVKIKSVATRIATVVLTLTSFTFGAAVASRIVGNAWTQSLDYRARLELTTQERRMVALEAMRRSVESSPPEQRRAVVQLVDTINADPSRERLSQRVAESIAEELPDQPAQDVSNESQHRSVRRMRDVQHLEQRATDTRRAADEIEEAIVGELTSAATGLALPTEANVFLNTFLDTVSDVIAERIGRRIVIPVMAKAEDLVAWIRRADLGMPLKMLPPPLPASRGVVAATNAAAYINRTKEMAYEESKIAQRLYSLHTTGPRSSEEERELKELQKRQDSMPRDRIARIQHLERSLNRAANQRAMDAKSEAEKIERERFESLP